MIKSIFIYIITFVLVTFNGCSKKDISSNIEKKVSDYASATTKIIKMKDEHIPDFDIICGVVMNEAGAEQYDGILAVAQCIYNACERENSNFGAIRNKYGYYYSKAPSETVKKAVKDVFVYGKRVTNRKIICFYNPDLCTSKWHESQIYVCTIGHHRFFEMRY